MWDSNWSHHSMYGAGDGSWFGMIGMHGIGMFLIFLLTVAITLVLFRIFFRSSVDNPALNALGTQYANGKISRETYLEKKKDLKQ